MLKRAHAGVAGIEIVQKVTPGALILASRFGSERSGERLGSPPEEKAQGIDIAGFPVVETK